MRRWFQAAARRSRRLKQKVENRPQLLKKPSAKNAATAAAAGQAAAANTEHQLIMARMRASDNWSDEDEDDTSPSS